MGEGGQIRIRTTLYTEHQSVMPKQRLGWSYNPGRVATLTWEVRAEICNLFVVHHGIFNIHQLIPPDGTPSFKFIAGSGFKHKLDISEASMHTSQGRQNVEK